MAKLAELAAGSSGNTSGGRIRRAPSPMDQLTDDLLIEIFSRVPYRSLHRFACVSRRWRDLIAHPDNHRKLPQTLAGFFYHDLGRTLPYISCAGPPSLDPCLSFLPERKGLCLVDGCNGLLLCRYYRFADPKEFEYLVINLTTEKWVAVPVSRRWSNKVQMARLGFDPAVSSHFHVFEFQLDWDYKSDSDDDESSLSEDEEDHGDGHVLGVEIYSSETGLWRYEQSNWTVDIELDSNLNSVFVCGMLYLVATSSAIDAVDVEDRTWSSVIGAVDVNGTTWRTIDLPHIEDSPFIGTDDLVDLAFIHLSQGKLHLANCDDITHGKLVIWVLEDCNSEKWTRKHTVGLNYLVRKNHVRYGFDVVAIHPDRNMVFFVFGRGKKLMSYDMDSSEVHMVSHLGKNCYGHYIPYVPLFSESLADGQK